MHLPPAPAASVPGLTLGRVVGALVLVATLGWLGLLGFVTPWVLTSRPTCGDACPTRNLTFLAASGLLGVAGLLATALLLGLAWRRRGLFFGVVLSGALTAGSVVVFDAGFGL